MWLHQRITGGQQSKLLNQIGMINVVVDREKFYLQDLNTAFYNRD